MSLESLVVNGINDLKAARYASLAAGVIIVYDHLNTLDREVELIWKAQWTIVKYLFFVNRYYSLCCVVINNYALFTTSLTDSVCLHWFRWQGWTTLVTCMIAEVILQMRLYALYLLNKKVLAFMIVCFLASSGCAAVIMGTVLSRVTAISELVPGERFCIPLGISPHFYTFWIPIIMFECLLGALALVRGIQFTRFDQGIFHFGRALVNILVRDSVIYFLIIFATYMTNLVVWATQSAYLTEIPVDFAVAMSCVMGNRIILNVRGLRRDLTSPSKDSGAQPSLPYQHQHVAPASPTSLDFMDPDPGVRDVDEMWELQYMQGEAL